MKLPGVKNGTGNTGDGVLETISSSSDNLDDELGDDDNDGDIEDDALTSCLTGTDKEGETLLDLKLLSSLSSVTSSASTFILGWFGCWDKIESIPKERIGLLLFKSIVLLKSKEVSSNYFISNICNRTFRVASCLPYHQPIAELVSDKLSQSQSSKLTPSEC